MLEVLLRLAGVLGFLVALLALGWQIWSWRAGRREMIKAKFWRSDADAEPGPVLVIDVANTSRVPVFIRDVLLLFSASWHEGYALERCGDAEMIEPGQAAQYAWIPTSSLESFLEGGADALQVIIETQSGFKKRIPGEEFIGELRLLAGDLEAAGRIWEYSPELDTQQATVYEARLRQRLDLSDAVAVGEILQLIRAEGWEASPRCLDFEGHKVWTCDLSVGHVCLREAAPRSLRSRTCFTTSPDIAALEGLRKVRHIPPIDGYPCAPWRAFHLKSRVGCLP